MRRVFVSYSHADRNWRDAFQLMLGPGLERFAVELWADDQITSGDDWERMIDTAIEDAVLALLLVTPAHLGSTFIWRREVPALIEAGVPIVWALVKDCLWQYNELLVHLQGLQDPGRDGALADQGDDQNKELARICRKLCEEHLSGLHPTAQRLPTEEVSVLATPVAKLSSQRPGRVLGPVPMRPSAFVPRPEALENLRAYLVEGLAGAVGITATPSASGLYGQGGVGKSVLAAEITRDEEALGYFPDGVFWLSLGEQADVVRAQRQLAEWLGGDPKTIRSTWEGLKLLRELAEDKQCLIVLDDVWSRSHAEALAVNGPMSRLLITTRDKLLLQLFGAATISLDVLGDGAARELLGLLTATSPSALPVEANLILEATGRVALAVALAGAAVGRGGQGWEPVASRLAEAGQIFEGHPYADVFKALEVATASLSFEERARYQALACFPEDTMVPTVTIGRLWGLAEPELGAQLRRFRELRLARVEKGGVAFHDLERDFLLLHAGAVASAHEQLLATHRPSEGASWDRLDPTDPYLWDRLMYHLAAAGFHRELIETATDPAWLAARMHHDGSLAAERDVREALRWEPGEARLLPLLRRLQQTSHLLDRAKDAVSVAACLATHLWPLQKQLDLSRLDDTPFGRPPIVVWVADSTSPQLVRILEQAGWVSSVAWSPDGSRLASGVEGTVRISDAATGTKLTTLLGHTGWVRSVAWSPDGTRLASGAAGTVRVWDATTGAELVSLSGHTAWVRAVAWSPDGRRLASAGDERSVRVWDVPSGAQLAVLSGNRSGVKSLAWSPDGRSLASAGDDRTVRIWDPVTGTELVTLSGLIGGVRSVAWSPDGSRLASGAERVVQVWDATTWDELAELSGHTDQVNSLAWSPEGARLASAADDRTVRVWDAVQGTQLVTLSGHTASVKSVVWSPDGALLASGTADGRVWMWDTATGKDGPGLSNHTGWVKSVAWSPDGSLLAWGSGDGPVRISDGTTGLEVGLLSGHTGRVRSVTWSPDGTRLVSCAPDDARVWDSGRGSNLGALSGHDGGVSSVAWSPDGSRIAGAGSSLVWQYGVVWVWDAKTRTQLLTLYGQSGWVSSVEWSPDGTRLASGAADGTVWLWDAVAGTVLMVLSGPAGSIRSVAWSPDGRLLAFGSANGTIWLSDVVTGELLTPLCGHAGSVWSMAWLDDGIHLASGGADGTVRLWAAMTGDALCEVVLGEHVWALDYSKRSGLAVGVDRSVFLYRPLS